MKQLFLITTVLLNLVVTVVAVPPSNDTIGGAIDLTSLVVNNNGTWCSSDDTITYSNVGATSDGAKPSCMHSSHNVAHNVWFKYKVGSSQEFNLDLKIEGITGNLGAPYLTMWTDDDTTDNEINLIEVMCRKYKGSENIGIGKAGLNEGQYYYVSIDNVSTAVYEGNFQVCVSDQVSFDFADGAVDVTNLINNNSGTWCSADDSITYTNIDGSADGAKPSCMHSTHNVVANVWFKHKVGSSGAFNLDLKIEGITGNLRVPYLTMWTDDDTTDNELNLVEIMCRKYKGSENIGIGKAGLNVGQYYYVSIDNASTAVYEGNFQVCVSDQVGFDFVDGAVDVTDLINNNSGTWCSADDSITYTNIDGSPDEAKPSCMHWSHSVVANVWFKYKVGSSQEFNLNLKIEGITGNLRVPYLTMWTDDDTTDNEINLIEVMCRSYKGSENIGIGKAGLNVGQYYYVSIDNASTAVYEGNFQVCVSDQVSFDFADGAVDVTDLINNNSGTWCSADDSITYTNIDGSADEAKPSCMHYSHNVVANVWFKYKVGSSQEFNLDLKIEGITGNLRVPYLTMWTDDDTTDNELNLVEIMCRKYKSSENIGIGKAGLNVGQYYYVSIDNASTAVYEGNFQVCVSDQVGFDFVDGAVDVTDLINNNSGTWCSADDSITYNNLEASPDEAKPSCSYYSHNVTSNVWYKYKAGANRYFRFDLKIAGINGNLRVPYITAWTDDDTTDNELNLIEVFCKKYEGTSIDIGIELSTLNVGQYYYISVDNASTGAFEGNFQICVSDQASYDFVAGAIDVTDNITIGGGDWCSADSNITYSTVGATLDESAPSCLIAGHNWGANVWFKYLVGPSKEFNFEMKVSGITGAHKKASISLWTDNDTTDEILTLVEVQCEASTGDYSDNALGVAGLNEGQYYYIMVHPYDPVWAGNFQICVSDQVSFDFIAGAADMTAKLDSNDGYWSSVDSGVVYTSQSATLDGEQPSCQSDVVCNVWFKYHASAYGVLDVEALTGGSEGTMGRVSLSIWKDTTGNETLKEVGCLTYDSGSSAYADRKIEGIDLEPNRTFFISVQTYSPVYLGTFSLVLERTQIKTPEDLFSMNIYYDEIPSELDDLTLTEEQFNGNISAVEWQVLNEDERAYSYAYDPLNRLTDAHSGRSLDNLGTFSYDNDFLDVYAVNNITYDLNGNILTLDRSGLLGIADPLAPPFSTDHPYGPLDDLSYDYTGNQLFGVTDGISDPQVNVSADITSSNNDHFLDGNLAASGDDYDYDDNGNLILDLNKDIIIEYNILNLPIKVSWDDGSFRTIEWVYDATGQKLQKIVDDGASNITVKNYIGNSEYEAGSLEAIYHPEGRATPVGDGTYYYEYSITDHLGNGRLWWRWVGDAETGAPEIIQTADYYPFGLQHSDPDAIAATGAMNRYKFNGIERIGDFDLGWDLTMARPYDYMLGRFTGIDPMSEFASDWTPYRFGFNNPINTTDPLGLFESHGIYKREKRQESKLVTAFEKKKFAELDAEYETTAKNVEVKDNIHIGDDGIVDKVDRNDEPNKFFDEDGNELNFHDPELADEDNTIYQKGDRVYSPLSIETISEMIEDAGKIKNWFSLARASYGRADFWKECFNSVLHRNGIKGGNKKWRSSKGSSRVLRQVFYRIYVVQYS